MESAISRYPDLDAKIDRFWELSARKIRSVESEYDFSKGSPVFTWDGRYTTRGWTEWTEGFVYGSAILQFDATGDEEFLDIGRSQTVGRMAKHITHTGVHDHGFNNVSTYGNLLRLCAEGRIESDQWERDFYRLALKCSGAVQSSRWSVVEDGGFVYSFNGPHSLFADTIRSLRALASAHVLGHVLVAEHDEVVSLLDRLIVHADTTAKYIVFRGEGRDSYDVAGRTAHEAIFNMNDGKFRCPGSQQGFSPFTTWTRGLAWIITGFVEELEFIESLDDSSSDPIDNAAPFQKSGGKESVLGRFASVAAMCADFYLANSGVDGIPYWDTGAPGMAHIHDWRQLPADPYNEHEPVDSSAAAITAQGLIRLGRYLESRDRKSSEKYTAAGVKIIDALIGDPYLSTGPDHQGLLLHSVYHRPNGWDRIPHGRKVPCDESSMWGDYHLREAVLLLARMVKNEPYYTFWNV